MTDSTEECKCFITHVEPFENLLKVCFQKDTEASLLVESHLNDLSKELEFGPYVPKKSEVLVTGLVCFGKFEDEKFYRVKILGCDKNGVNVVFIDYGNDAILNVNDIRVHNQNPTVNNLLCVSPLATTAYLQGVSLIKPLTEDLLTKLKKNLLYTNKTCSLKTNPQSISLIDICIEKKHAANILIDLGVGKSITDADLISRVHTLTKPMQQEGQRSYGRSLVSHRLQVRNKTAQPEIVNQNSQYDERPSSTNNTLPVGQTYNVYITHIEDGPYSFSAQLKNHNEEIQPQIDTFCIRNPPRPNSAPLLPGSQILGRSQHDNKFKRAVVMQVRANSCKVYFMDYGTTDELPQSDIYILSQTIRDLAHPQAMAFCIANLQSLNLPESTRDIFAKLVLNKQVLLRVTQSEPGSLTQCCEMFLDGKNVRDMLLNIASPLEFTNQFPPRGREIACNVSFVDCPNQFFIQYRSELNILGMIQDSLSTYCPNQERLQTMSQINISSPIGSLYTIDNMWYRALVIGIEDDTVNVLYVDYGNRDNVQ